MRKEKQLWADKEFVSILNRIKAKRMIRGKNNSLAQITKMIIKNPNFQKIEKDMEENIEKADLSFMRFD